MSASSVLTTLSGLIGWLNKNDFKFGDRDRAAFDSYISKGWCFVVAIINPSTGEEERRIVSEGLAAPLILRFPHEPHLPCRPDGHRRFRDGDPHLSCLVDKDDGQ